MSCPNTSQVATGSISLKLNLLSFTFLVWGIWWVLANLYLCHESKNINLLNGKQLGRESVSWCTGANYPGKVPSTSAQRIPEYNHDNRSQFLEKGASKAIQTVLMTTLNYSGRKVQKRGKINRIWIALGSINLCRNLWGGGRIRNLAWFLHT